MADPDVEDFCPGCEQTLHTVREDLSARRRQLYPLVERLEDEEAQGRSQRNALSRLKRADELFVELGTLLSGAQEYIRSANDGDAPMLAPRERDSDVP